jgi:predicted nucleotidyltransferase
MKKKTNHSSNDRARQLVAQEAARIIINQGVRDYKMAKIKAAQKLGLDTRGSLPANSEIERAIEEHHQLFGGESHTHLLQAMRETALYAMEMLVSFTPRLVGPVLAGTADENSAVNLHVFSDTPELVAAELDSQRIQYRPYERRLKRRHGEFDTYPGFEFRHDTSPVQATVFPIDGIRQSPLSPVDGRPMDRADANRVKDLVD